ncbi:hypothetical protein N7468_005350 [Penicillium chermesinum]|uniref:Uncharacterized protein n=1 Tax=Penicillium chermesinum TaxID=63820 RepID=A0A9W9NZ25_9EURO|nr:uncharacterized protein N7468_005350 [Penicillium chermesinum]KAJ5232394.1 hypothetical protein N7468_005350 [Penicillium chermesinum]
MPSKEPDVRSAWERRFDRKPVSSNPVYADLDVEHNELVQTWKAFIHHLPPEDRVQWEPRPQTATDVHTLMQSLKSYWMERPRQRVFRRAIVLCDKFLPTVDTHALVLVALPDGARYYIPLLYAVLQSVIKASSNYPLVIEGFITTMLDINLALQLPGNPNSSDVEPIARTYALVFLLLTEFMDWYRQARTFNGADDMEIDNERDAAYTPRSLWEESQLSQVGRHGDRRRHAAQNTMTRRLIWDIQQDAEKRDRLRETREQLLAQVLRAVDGKLDPVNEKSSDIVCLTTAAPDLVTPHFEWSRGSKRRLARLELQSESKHLQPFFDSDDQIAELEPDEKVVVEASVITALRKWVTSPRSQALAVGGSASTTFPSPVGRLSACYASFAREARLPQGLIALTYSLIRQMIDTLPTVVDSDSLLDLTAERFRKVDGSLASWTAALSLVDTLLHFAPPLLVCIIDGIDKIHDESTDVALRELLRVLLTHTRHQPPVSGDSPGPAFLFKVLFTVAVRPSALVDTMSENELVLSETALPEELNNPDAVLASDLAQSQ